MPAARRGDGWRLAVGTLTALPVAAPHRVGRGTARTAVLIAPLAVVPLGLAVAAALWVADRVDLPSLAGGLLAVGVLALGTRAFHLDGLADTADGLTASYDRERSLAVMKSGAVGPAGAVALIVVLGLQAVAFGELSGQPWVAALLVCASRSELALACMSGVPAAGGDGLRAPFAGAVPRFAALGLWVTTAAACAVLFDANGADWQRLIVGFVVATFVVALLLRRAVIRLGGVTGDLFGATIEVALVVLLLAAIPPWIGVLAA